ncbi:transporter substrate-binding domain-containing protein [Paraburkholderia phytofirmans]
MTRVKLVVSDFGALVPALLAHRFDAIAAGLYITPTRCKLVAFSDPDLKLSDAAIVREGKPEHIDSYAAMVANRQIIVGAGRGNSTAANAKAAGGPDDRLLLFPDVHSAVAALQVGRVQVVVYSSPLIATLMTDPKIRGVSRVSHFKGLVGSDGKIKFGYSAVAFRKEDLDLLDFYNARSKEMKKDGTVAGAMTKYGFGGHERSSSLTAKDVCDGRE